MTEEETRKTILSSVDGLISNINDFLMEAESINDGLDYVLKRLSKEELFVGKLYNVGITYNNKLVEIFQLYKRKKLLVSESCLRFVIINYLSTILANTTKCIEKYFELVKIIDVMIRHIRKTNIIFKRFTINKNRELLSSMIKEAQKALEEYRSFDKEIDDFNLERDAMKLYESQKGFFSNFESKGVKRDNFIMECNKELKVLGIETRFPIETMDIGDLPTYNELIDIISDTINKVSEQYEKFPVTSWTILNRMNDNFELLKRAYETKDIDLYRKTSERITSFNYLELSPWIVDIVGETLAFYGLSYEELDMLRKELAALGFGDKISEIESNIANEKYEEYIKLQINLLETSNTKKIILPTFK